MSLHDESPWVGRLRAAIADAPRIVDEFHEKAAKVNDQLGTSTEHLLFLSREYGDEFRNTVLLVATGFHTSLPNVVEMMRQGLGLGEGQYPKAILSVKKIQEVAQKVRASLGTQTLFDLDEFTKRKNR